MTRAAAICVARLIFAAVFAITARFKFLDMHGTAGYIGSAGFPVPLALAWIAAILRLPKTSSGQ